MVRPWRSPRWPARSGRRHRPLTTAVPRCARRAEPRGSSRNVRYEFTEFAVVLHLIAAGMAVAMLPRLAFTEPITGYTVHPVATGGFRRRIFAASRIGNKDRPAVQAVLAAVEGAVERFGPGSPLRPRPPHVILSRLRGFSQFEGVDFPRSQRSVSSRGHLRIRSMPSEGSPTHVRDRPYPARRYRAGAMMAVAGATLVGYGGRGIGPDSAHSGDHRGDRRHRRRQATLNGNVNPNSLATTYYFEYGTTTSYGLDHHLLSAPGRAPVACRWRPSSPASRPTRPTTSSWSRPTLTASIIGGSAQRSSRPRPATLFSENRVAGNDRYQTSAMIAEAKYPGGVPSGNVVVATGADFPDALAGNYLAGQLEAPILLTPGERARPRVPDRPLCSHRVERDPRLHPRWHGRGRLRRRNGAGGEVHGDPDRGQHPIRHHAADRHPARVRPGQRHFRCAHRDHRHR